MSTRYPIRVLSEYFKKHKIATREQLVEALGNPARCTFFRKLDQMEYMSSYSHRGMYYTLKSIAQFSSDGLWEYRSVWFSQFGNLLETAEVFVNQSERGYSAVELTDILHVKTKHVLMQLVRAERLHREKIGSCYIYLSLDREIAGRQQKARKSHGKRSFAALVVKNPKLADEEAKAAILLFCSMLDEKQRRLYAGLESLKLGHGGDIHIGSLLGMDPHTVARGRQELMDGDLDSDGIRNEGGGRLSQEKKLRKS